MAIYTLATNNYNTSTVEVRNEYATAANPIITPYITSGVCTNPSTYTPALPDGIYPPTSGIYVARRDWTSQTDAQSFCDQIATLLTNNPSYTTFVTSAPIVYTE
jgi:hypothetical protein